MNEAMNEAKKEAMISYKELSEMIGLPLGTLYCMVHFKRIPHVRLGKRLVRFSRVKIIEWLMTSEVYVGGSHE